MTNRWRGSAAIWGKMKNGWQYPNYGAGSRLFFHDSSYLDSITVKVKQQWNAATNVIHIKYSWLVRAHPTVAVYTSKWTPGIFNSYRFPSRWILIQLPSFLELFPSHFELGYKHTVRVRVESQQKIYKSNWTYREVAGMLVIVSFAESIYNISTSSGPMSTSNVKCNEGSSEFSFCTPTTFLWLSSQCNFMLILFWITIV